jgi:hypothetical protein
VVRSWSGGRWPRAGV